MGLYDRYEGNQDKKKPNTIIVTMKGKYEVPKWKEVQLTECGKVVNVRYMSKKKEPIIRRIDKDTYGTL